MIKKTKVYVVHIKELSDWFYYRTLSKADSNHNLGVSVHTLYKFPFDEQDFENDICTIRKRWAQ